MSIDLISPREYDFVSTKLREFFKSKGLIEACCQNSLTILAACEDPSNVTSFDYCGSKWPMKQTNQMSLESIIMNNPDVPGYFCTTTSYREEKDPVPGRHDLIFPMFEFEIHGDFSELITFEKELLEHLGFGNSFPEGDYLDICKRYGVEELTHEHEKMILRDYGPVFFLKNFPETTSPFFNMSRDSITGLSNKVDVIINGIETFGSASRSSDPVDMRKRFYSISDGEYCKMLFEKFGKERVEKELDEFLSLNFIPRSGCGIGGTRLIKGMKALGLL